jgi:NADH-quinone oxidoreductase subunit C
VHETATKLLANKLPALLEAFPSDVLDAEDFRGDLTVVVRPERIQDIARFLKTNAALPFEVLMDLFAMDYLKTKTPTPERFAMIYNFYSVSKGRRVRLKAYLPEANPEIDSLVGVYKMANWFEREAWDLYGIRFRGHPRLTRILTHHEFQGHPLRKDYPADKYQRLKTSLPSSEL